ncbi:hypothetical protein LSH36_202g03035 [Paralvinella palmiformis]|uniref:Exonuclease domain-containing protein n=1 Tax=Paralvinella palmiformis TaxID=53620 RepID=A0AAD9JPM3_9ANNE|nr:hypothetical protein LSH36_202g03035 [Paralvinella palmiformis]
MFRVISDWSYLLLRREIGRTMASINISKSGEVNRLVWVDLEMSGLDVNNDHILEMACLISDGQLNLIAEGPDLVIHQPDEVLEQMEDWCKEHHGQSGLTAAVRQSEISLNEAEGKMLDFISQHTQQGKSPLAGNSVHMDRLFLQKYMPRFTSHLHYRIVDVSTVKELCRRWYPKELKGAPAKALNHRALDDIHESMKELQYYKKVIFK